MTIAAPQLDDLRDLVLGLWPPPPTLTISEWADTYRRLSSESSAEEGQWRTDRAPYQRGIMDAIVDTGIDEVWVMKSAQIGWTEILGNTIGYYAHQDPSPIIIMQPTLEIAEAWSKDRLAPMIRDTPVLTDIFPPPGARTSGNTLLHKQFPGGHITAVGANSPASLASRPARILLYDEVDRYPPSAGTEGDPISILMKRATTFHNRRIVGGGTPTYKGISPIERHFDAGDQRRYHVPCPACTATNIIAWKHFDFSTRGTEDNPLWICPACEEAIDHGHKLDMVHAGHWLAQNPFKGIASFHIWEGYSPWVHWAEIVEAFKRAKKGGRETLKVWINTSLGETFEEAGETLSSHELAIRREPYPIRKLENDITENLLPAGILLLTAGIDTQDDRLEVKIEGWGDAYESWLWKYQVIYGNTAIDPNAPRLEGTVNPWHDLLDLLLTTWPTEKGLTLGIASAAIDDSGHRSDYVRTFTKANAARRIYAVRGINLRWQPILGRPSIRNKHRVRIYPIGTDTVKAEIYANLRVAHPGPRYCHFPPWTGDDYFAQLTSETLVTRFHRGFEIKEWHKPPGARNEALDTSVYSRAALALLNPDFQRIAKYRAAQITAAQETKQDPSDTPKPPPQTRTTRPRRTGFISKFNRR